MSNLLKIYDTRKCLVCQKTFEATRPAQVTCSEKCRITRRKALKRETRQLNNELLCENLEWLNCKLEELVSTRKAHLRKEKDISQKEVPDQNKTTAKKEAKKEVSEKYRHICVNCGSTFKSPYKDDSYCCDQCAKEATAGGIV